MLSCRQWHHRISRISCHDVTKDQRHRQWGRNPRSLQVLTGWMRFLYLLSCNQGSTYHEKHWKMTVGFPAMEKSMNFNFVKSRKILEITWKNYLKSYPGIIMQNPGILSMLKVGTLCNLSVCFTSSCHFGLIYIWHFYRFHCYGIEWSSIG